MRKEERFRRVLAYFMETLPAPRTELSYINPYELAVAVMLSAQCTDKRVNQITPGFFGKYPDVGSLAAAREEDVFELIRICSYPNNKTRHLIGMARQVMAQYGGILPDTASELQKLPGIGRKTAHVLVSVLFNEPVLAVDTHVFRVSARIGLTTGAKTSLDAERQLVRYIPRDMIHKAHHWLILHGRYVCHARNPECAECGIRSHCRFFSTGRIPPVRKR